MSSLTVAADDAARAVMEAFARQPDAAAALDLVPGARRGARLQPGRAGRRRGRAALHRGRGGRAPPRARTPCATTWRRCTGSATASIRAAASSRPSRTRSSTRRGPAGRGTSSCWPPAPPTTTSPDRGPSRPACAGSGCRCSRRAPSPPPLTTSLADADTLRYYPAYESAPLGRLGEQTPGGGRAPPAAAAGPAPRRRADHRGHPRLRGAVRLRAVRGPDRTSSSTGPGASSARSSRRCSAAGRASTRSASTATSACARRSSPACGW